MTLRPRVWRGNLALLLLWLLSACSGDPSSAVPVDAGNPADQATPADVVAPDPAGEDVAAAEVGSNDVEARQAAQVVLGKELLAAGESLAAYDLFTQMLVSDPDLPEALIGASLAEVQMWAGFLDSLLGVAGRTEDPDATTAKKGARKDATSALYANGLAGQILAGLLRQTGRQIDRLEKLTEVEELNFALEALPLSLLGEVALELRGEWDLADVYSLLGLARMFHGVFLLLDAWDWDVALDTLEGLLDNDDGFGPALAGLLDAHPALLQLRDPDTAAETWNAAREAFRQGAQDLLEAEARMAAEEDDQGDDVATLGSYGSLAVLTLRGAFPSGAETLSLLWHGEQASLRDSLSRLVAHLDGDSASRLRFGDDVLVSLGIFVDVLQRTVGLSTLLDAFGVSLPAAVGGLLGMLDPESPDAVVLLLPQMLALLGLSAGDISLDLDRFLTTPLGLRDMLPLVGTDPLRGSADLLRSFECVRGGLRSGDWVPGEPLRVVVHDPLAAAGSQVVFSTEAGDEAVDLTPIGGVQGLLAGEMVGVDETVGAVTVSYTRDALTLSFVWEPEAGRPVFSLSTACADAAPTWDGAHFFESEFLDREVFVDGRWGLLTATAPDGVVRTSAYLAFGSPSFGGLLWLGTGDGAAEADQDGINGLLAELLAGVDQF